MLPASAPWRGFRIYPTETIANTEVFLKEWRKGTDGSILRLRYSGVPNLAQDSSLCAFAVLFHQIHKNCSVYHMQFSKILKDYCLASQFKKVLHIATWARSKFVVSHNATLAACSVPLISGFAYFLSTLRFGKSSESDTELQCGRKPSLLLFSSWVWTHMQILPCFLDSLRQAKVKRFAAWTYNYNSWKKRKRISPLSSKQYQDNFWRRLPLYYTMMWTSLCRFFRLIAFR